MQNIFLSFNVSCVNIFFRINGLNKFLPIAFSSEILGLVITGKNSDLFFLVFNDIIDT